MVETARKRKGNRISIVLNEWIGGDRRRVAKWGPYSDQKRAAKAEREALAMREKLMHLWPCTFLVKGYDYKPPPIE